MKLHSIDGATPGKPVNTLPLLIPQILIALLFLVCSGFRDFRLDCCNDRGPEVQRKGVAVHLLYRDALLRFCWGSARGVTFMLLIVAIASFLPNKSRCQNLRSRLTHDCYREEIARKLTQQGGRLP